MTVQLSNTKFSNIGRMFARQNVPSVYGAQKNASGITREEPSGAVDKVSLSAFAPRPLPAEYVERALESGKTLGQGRAISARNGEAIREDRVFAAVSALALMGFAGEEAFTANWPGGFPQPTREELDVARRRLAQRPYATEEAADIEKLQQDRLELLHATSRPQSQSL